MQSKQRFIFRFHGQVKVTCYEKLVKNPVKEVEKWLSFLNMDSRRLGCINVDLDGEFQRERSGI